MARPCPSAQIPAAKAIEMPAARIPMGPTHPAGPSAACAAAWAAASVGTLSTARTPRTSERRTPVLLCEIGLLVVLRMVLLVLERAGDVEHRQHDEDERLEERHQDLQRVEEADREGDHHQPADPADEDPGGIPGQRPADEAVEPHEKEDDGEQDVPAEHVAEEPERERERAREVTDGLDDEHQG